MPRARRVLFLPRPASRPFEATLAPLLAFRTTHHYMICFGEFAVAGSRLQPLGYARAAPREADRSALTPRRKKPPYLVQRQGMFPNEPVLSSIIHRMLWITPGKGPHLAPHRKPFDGRLI